MKYFEDDIPRYRKKSSKKHTKKSNHKHESSYCVFEYSSIFFKKTTTIGTYCPICGLIRELRVHDDRYTEPAKLKHLSPSSTAHFRDWNALAHAEFNPYTRSLPFFKFSNPWETKYVNLEVTL